MLRISTGLQQNLLGGSGGDSVQQLLLGGVLRIFSGTQPSSCDDVEVGTLLAEVSLSGATFVPGATSTNGLTFADPVDGVLSKTVSEAWNGAGVAAGSAGWFRFYDSNRTVGASTSSVRLDGAIATSGGEINMANSQIEIGTPVIINSFDITLPKS